MLSFILSRPDDWEIHVEELSKNTISSRNKTDSAYRELVEAGYIYQVRRSLGYKKWKWFKFASDKRMSPQIKADFDKQVDDWLKSQEINS